MANLMDQSKMLEWAGINFGEDTVYLIQKSLKKLAQQSSASPLKFFGKIYGTQKDYWVAQGQLPFSEEVSANP
jgi:radial spoke head protein 4/6